MQIKIDRSKWVAGITTPYNLKRIDIARCGKGQNIFKNSEGFYCINGMCLKQFGVDENYLLNVFTVDELAGYEIWREDCTDDIESFLICRHDYNNIVELSPTKLMLQAMRINDSQITLAKKEDCLKKLFKESGYELVFYGDYVL